MKTLFSYMLHNVWTQWHSPAEHGAVGVVPGQVRGVLVEVHNRQVDERAEHAGAEAVPGPVCGRVRASELRGSHRGRRGLKRLQGQ